MTLSEFLPLLFTFLGAGGGCTLIVTLLNRKKTNSEVIDQNVDTALKLTKVAEEMYDKSRVSLGEAQNDLLKAREELYLAKMELISARSDLKTAAINYDIYKRHCLILEQLLKENKIPVPDRPSLPVDTTPN